MRSRVSYRFQIDSAYTCGRAKMLRVDANVFGNGEKSCGDFQTNTDTCGQALTVAYKATPTALGTWDACYFLKAILSIF